MPSFDARSTDGARDDRTLTSAPPLPRRSFAMPAEPTPSIAGYEMLGELGRGGMGMVFKARQTSLDRVVAIKLLTAGSRQRFRTEAETIARVKHPNIVQIYAIGDCGGRPYIELEFVEGGSLGGRGWTGRRGLPRSAARPDRVHGQAGPCHALRPVSAASFTETSSRPTS